VQGGCSLGMKAYLSVDAVKKLAKGGFEMFEQSVLVMQLSSKHHLIHSECLLQMRGIVRLVVEVFGWFDAVAVAAVAVVVVAVVVVAAAVFVAVGSGP
jgi:hypothetical protein